MTAEIAAAEAILKKLCHQAFVVGERRNVITQIARRKHLQIAPQCRMAYKNLIYRSALDNLDLRIGPRLPRPLRNRELLAGAQADRTVA